MTRPSTTPDVPDTRQDAQGRDTDEAIGGHIVTTGERHLAIEHWLLLSARDRVQARAEWQHDGLTYLRCGARFTAVRIPDVLVHAAAKSRAPEQVDAFLAHALEGGPVIASPGLSRYYVLVPPSAAAHWREDTGTQCLPAGMELGVPPLSMTRYERGVSYWAVEPASAGELCQPGLADRLARYGQRKWAELRR
jgi:hypothetical protein